MFWECYLCTTILKFWILHSFIIKCYLQNSTFRGLKLISYFFSILPPHCRLLLGIQHKKLFPILLSQVWHWTLDILRLGVWRLLWSVCRRLLLRQTGQPSWCPLQTLAPVCLHSTSRSPGCGHPALPTSGGFWWVWYFIKTFKNEDSHWRLYCLRPF